MALAESSKTPLLQQQEAHRHQRHAASDPGGRLLRWHDGRLAYAVVDYELLERTAAHEAWRRRAGGFSYADPPSASSLSVGALNPKS